VLLLGAILAWPVSWALLALYKRAVRRSMMQSSHPRPTAATTAPPDPAPVDTATVPGAAVVLQALDGQTSRPEAKTLSAQLESGPTFTFLVYAAGGVAYAIVCAVATTVATRIEFLPLRTLMFGWTFAWPIVIAAGLVLPRGHRLRPLALVAHFAGLAVIVGTAVSISPSFSWAQGAGFWGLNNLPATLLLLPFFSRHVRAVGPLVMTFLLVTLMGAQVALSVLAGSDRQLLVLADISLATGLGAGATLAMVALVGVAVFAALGWLALSWIGRRYRAKRISDQSVTLDAVWLLFAFTHLIGLVFEHPAWVVAIAVAFAAYKAATRAGFSWGRRARKRPENAPVLLLLRSFALGRASERLFDALEKHWRHVGSMQLIAGVDLASRTIEPHELLDFASGKLARRFIDGAGSLAVRMKERDLDPDPDLRYRVNDFFCFDNAWRLVLLRLVDESDVVLMDLRGFTAQNAGCVFEIRQIVTLSALDRVVFIVDQHTDEALLTSTLRDAAATVPRTTAITVGVFRAEQQTGADVRRLLRVLAEAGRQVGR
jgi:hypothetical protein